MYGCCVEVNCCCCTVVKYVGRVKKKDRNDLEQVETNLASLLHSKLPQTFNRGKRTDGESSTEDLLIIATPCIYTWFMFSIIFLNKQEGNKLSSVSGEIRPNQFRSNKASIDILSTNRLDMSCHLGEEDID
jgi:hypothetical protein